MDTNVESADDFPSYEDGDVKIVISGSRQYQLHSTVLSRVCPLIARLLRQQPPIKLASKAKKKGVTTRWRLDGVKPEEGHDMAVEIPILQPVRLTETGASLDSNPIPLDLENGLPLNPVYHGYDTILRLFYGKPLNLEWEELTDLNEILYKVQYVYAVAEYLEVIPLVATPIEAAILGTGQKLWQSIYDSPASWLDFAYCIKSKAIFREALIHAAGQFNTVKMRNAMREDLRPCLREVIEKKAEWLRHGVQLSVMKMSSYYPLTMQRTVTLGYVDVDKIGKASYESDIFGWIALTALRHWLLQSIADDHTHHSTDMGYQFMKTIQKGEQEYLGARDMEDFHKYFPMSQKGASVMAAKLTDMKDHIKTFIAHLLDHEAQLDVNMRQHFTCVRVNYTDIPWVNKPPLLYPKEEEEESEEEAQSEAEIPAWDDAETPVAGWEEAGTPTNSEMEEEDDGTSLFLP